MDNLFSHKTRSPIAASLGDRELKVLETLWQSAPRSAVEIHEAMYSDGISLNTVQSTLERLHRKGLLDRSKSGRKFLYAPVFDKAELISGLLSDMANELAAGDMRSMVSGFLRFLNKGKGLSFSHHELAWLEDKLSSSPDSPTPKGADEQL